MKRERSLVGSAWVSNRSEGAQFSAGSITRIGVLDGGTLIPPTTCEPDNRATFAPPFAYNTCVDRNGDGMITTSNGLIPLPWSHENPLEFGTVDTAEDECIISYVELNAQNARHISVNKHNDVWVGGSKNNNTFDLVDGETGAILKTFDVGVGGYGGLIDCNDVLWSVGLSGNPGLFRYDTNQNITASECCAPDVLADSNEDFEINEQDQLVETVSPGFIAYVNENDDNNNGTPDMFESPVGYEADLAEVQLFAGCSPDHPAAWWSLSWPDPAPDPDPIKIWFFSDKSDGQLPVDDPNYPANAVAGTAINNYDPIVDNAEAKYPWPPPASVWVEALAPYDDLDLTFTVQPNPSEPKPSQTVKFSVKPRFEVKLRIVMVVEPGADLDFPPADTGGCKLTRFDVASLVVALRGDHSIITRGLSLKWDGTFHKLESACMTTTGIQPPVLCGDLATSAPGSRGNIREVLSPWFTEFVVNNEGGGTAALIDHGDESQIGCPNGGLFCDGYDFDSDADCTLNIYFVGHVRAVNPDLSIVDFPMAYTGLADPPWSKPYIVINDLAYTENTVEPNVSELVKWKVLVHEVGCHYLPRSTVHTGMLSDRLVPCPNDICMGGLARDDCMANHEMEVPSEININRMRDTINRLRNNCQIP